MRSFSLSLDLRRNLPGLLALCALLYFLLLTFYLADAIRLVVLFAWLALTLLCWQRRCLEVDRLPRLGWWLPAVWGGWAGWTLLSSVWSVNPAYTLQAWGADVLGGVLLFGLGLAAALARPAWRRYAAGVVAAWLLVMWLTLLSFGHWPTIHELFYPGVWGGEAYFSGGILLLLPFLLVWQAELLKQKRFVLPLLAFALYLVIVYQTKMRIMWLALAAALLIFFVMLLFMAEFKALRRRVLLLGGSMLLLCGVLFVDVSLQKPPSWSTPYAAPDVAGAFVQNERYAIWSFWWDRVWQHPWMGLGYGLYNPTNTYAHPLPPGFKSDMLTHAHNIALDVLLQVGFVGLLLWLGIFAALLQVFWRRIRFDGVWAAAGVVLVLLPLLRNPTDDTWFGNNALVWWGVLGFWIGASVPQSDKKRQS